MNNINLFIKKYSSLNIVVKASIWFTICSFLQKGISIVTMPIFTRLLSTAEYGRYSIYVSWYNIFIIFMTLNIHKEIFNKGLIENDEAKDEYTTNQMGLIIVLGIIFTVLYAMFHNIINTVTSLSIFLTTFLILEVVSNSIVSLWTARKRFDYEYKKIIAITLLTSITNPVIGVLLVLLSSYKVEARVVSVVIVPLILSLIFLIIYSKKGKFFKEKFLWKKAVVRSIPLLPHYLSLVLLNQADKLMINHFYNSSYAAIYSIAHTAGLLMVLVNESLNNAFVPWAYGKIKENKAKNLQKMISPLLLTVLVANLILIWIAPECIYLLAPQEYRGAIWCIVPIAVSVYCTFIYTLFVDVEIYYNGGIFVTLGSVLATIINIILNYIFIPKYGYIAAAYTTFISYLITAIMHYFFLKTILKRNNIKQDMFEIRKMIIVFVLLITLSIIALLTYDNYIIRYLFILALIVIAFLKKKNIIMAIKNMKAKK